MAGLDLMHAKLNGKNNKALQIRITAAFTGVLTFACHGIVKSNERKILSFCLNGFLIFSPGAHATASAVPGRGHKPHAKVEAFGQ